MFNKVVLVGHLTRDVELRYTTSGNAIGNCAIAVTRKFSINGEKREEVCFIDIAFFGKQAETANQYLCKGSKLLIEGRLKLEQWTDNNGQNRSKHKVEVENIEMLGDGQGGNNQGGNSGYQPKADNHSSKQTQSYQPKQVYALGAADVSINNHQSNQAPNLGNRSQNGANSQVGDQTSYDDGKYYANDETIPF